MGRPGPVRVLLKEEKRGEFSGEGMWKSDTKKSKGEEHRGVVLKHEGQDTEVERWGRLWKGRGIGAQLFGAEGILD